MSARRPSAADSPWFWACLFASAGIFVLWYFSGQYDQRQLRIERQGQARLRAAEIAADGQPQTEVSMPGDLRIPLQPIFAILALLLAVGWAMYWLQRIRSRPIAGASPQQAEKQQDLQKGPT